jgi:formate dehydrogenase subunit gamma
MTLHEGTLVRNPPLSRVNHWITGICFVLLLLSGLSMFHPLLFWLSDLFGGGQWTRAIHPWIGVVLLFSYAGLIVQFWRDNLPRKADIGWVLAINRVLINQEEGVPEVARFNVGQKMVFWSMTLLIPVLFVTGIMIWEVYFFTYTSIEAQRIAVLIHCLAATGAIIVWIVHVYAAIWVHGSVRAMTQGYVTPGWAWRHHRQWFRSLAASGSRGPTPLHNAPGPIPPGGGKPPHP